MGGFSAEEVRYCDTLIGTYRPDRPLVRSLPQHSLSIAL